MKQLLHGANALRAQKVAEEVARLLPLPDARYPETEQIAVSVTSASTVRVKKNTYSVPSKLIGLKLDAHVGESEVRVTYEGHEVCRLARLQGPKVRIDYRHVIWSLVRKPPSALHWFGTDDLGRDILTRVIYGARASLMAGARIAAVPVSSGLGFIPFFSQCVEVILRHIGCDAFVTSRPDVKGVQEAVDRGARVLFVADDDVRYLDGLATPVPAGETVSIIPAVAGG